MRMLDNANWAGVVAATLFFPLIAAAGGARIESADKALGTGDSEGLSIESVDEREARAGDTDRPPGEGRAITLTVAAGPEGENTDLPVAEEQQFQLGKRQTVFKDSYAVSYIEDMRLNEQGERAPVVKDIAFGRWLDVSVHEADNDTVRATVYFVRKRPVNLDPNAEQPHMDLPEADFDMVSRQVQLRRGDSEKLLISGDDGAYGIRLGMPTR